MVGPQRVKTKQNNKKQTNQLHMTTSKSLLLYKIRDLEKSFRLSMTHLSPGQMWWSEGLLWNGGEDNEDAFIPFLPESYIRTWVLRQSAPKLPPSHVCTISPLHPLTHSLVIWGATWLGTVWKGAEPSSYWETAGVNRSGHVVFNAPNAHNSISKNKFRRSKRLATKRDVK